jgi:hypothetical protein
MARRTTALAWLAPLSVAAAGCGPRKPVVTDGASGTDINGDRRADLVAVSNTNGAAAAPHGVLLLPGSSTGLTEENAVGISTYADGTWAARVGDVNRDGASDFIVGSSSGNGTYDVRVFLGGATVQEQTARLRSARTEDGTAGRSLGGAAGDLNADGFADVVVVRRERTVSLHLGSAMGVPAQPVASLPLGDSEPIVDVRALGDTDGDGRSELALLHRAADGTSTVRVHRGAAGGIDPTPAFTIAGVSGGVAERVDVNRDGVFDLVTGAIAERPGCLHAFTGAPGGLSSARESSSDCQARPGTFAPPRVLRAGDVDADGFDDVMLFEAGLQSECATGTPVSFRVRVFRGTNRGLWPTDSSVVDGPSAVGCVLGLDASALGDVNADGYADVVVGQPTARSATVGQDGPGRLLLYLGTEEGLGRRLRISEGRMGTSWGLGRFAR